jgi:tetratricopeptide (TPR) repeat protein
MAHCNLGLARVKKGEYDEAIACFQHALELSPQDVNSLSGLGAALMHQGKADDAIRYLRIASEHLLSGHASALDERSDLVDAGIVCANLGKALEQQGRLDEAVAILQQALTIDPANADAHFTLGTTFFRQGHFEEAIECQRHVLELEPRAADALLELGRAQYRLGILDGAIVSFQGVIDLVPASIDARVALGTALCDRGDFDGAVACFHLAIEQDKDSASAHLGLGITLNMQGRHDDASVSLGRAVELDPTSAAANCELGMALTALGRLDDAILKLNRALDLAPNDPGCLNALGVACVKQGTLDDAIAHYTEALRIDPTFAEAHVNLGSVLEARGELEAAMDSMGRARELFAQRCDASSRNWASVVEKELSSLAARMARRQAIARLLRGEPQATTAGDPTAEDWTDVAQSAYAVHQYTAAARTFSLGFSALPEMLRSYPIRYNAACAAALAGCGKGSDAEELEEGERSAFRAQARAWLAAELERWREDFSAGGESARSAKEHVALAESDPDFDSVRDEAALQGLPDAEAQSWRVLWRDIAELIAVGEGKK